MTQATKWMAIAVAVCAIGCGKKKDKAPAVPSPTAGTPASSGPTPSASASPTPTAAPVDAFAMGSCEYTIDGAESSKGGGGMNNVGSLHWMPENQPGRSLGSALIINCGASGKQLNFSPAMNTTLDQVPMKPGKYPIKTMVQPGDFTVMGPGFMGGTGELDIAAWDTSHVTGTFTLEHGGKRYEGSFDLKCPTPGNGICS